MSASMRLAHLLDLADKGPALRAALAEEVAELLTDWPADCPVEMRRPCEALLTKAASEVDDNTRARLRVRLYADPQLCARVLPRETPEPMLVEAARVGDINAHLARLLGLAPETARQILDDRSGRALAVAAKAIGLSRAAFSALALLAYPDSDPSLLDAFEQVHAVEAARQLRGWLGQTQASAA